MSRPPVSTSDEPHEVVPRVAAPEPAAAVLQTSSTGRRMPGDFDISLATGEGVWLSGQEYGGRRQSLDGFEDVHTDIVDYIVRITHRIWEDQDVGYIYDTYAPGCRVWDDSGPRHGIEPMVAGTLATLSAFPTLRHYADEVIWAGDDQQGFVTSHRALNIGDHVGHWRWGPPTFRRLNTWVMANCVVSENLIREEWVLYNTAAALQQLGLDVAACARAYGNERALVPLVEPQRPGVQRLDGGRHPVALVEPDRRGSYDVEASMRALFHNVFNRRDLSAIDRFYAPNVRWYGTTNRIGYSSAYVRAQARELLATFPDLGVVVDEVYWMGNDRDRFRISVRWSGAGTHQGYALYGPPTGRQVDLWGLVQLTVRDGRIVEEWNLFNEFDVMAHLLCDEPAPRL